MGYCAIFTLAGTADKRVSICFGHVIAVKDTTPVTILTAGENFQVKESFEEVEHRLTCCLPPNP